MGGFLEAAKDFRCARRRATDPYAASAASSSRAAGYDERGVLEDATVARRTRQWFSSGNATAAATAAE